MDQIQQISAASVRLTLAGLSQDIIQGIVVRLQTHYPKNINAPQIQSLLIKESNHPGKPMYNSNFFTDVLMGCLGYDSNFIEWACLDTDSQTYIPEYMMYTLYQGWASDFKINMDMLITYHDDISNYVIGTFIKMYNDFRKDTTRYCREYDSEYIIRVKPLDISWLDTLKVCTNEECQCPGFDTNTRTFVSCSNGTMSIHEYVQYIIDKIENKK